MFNAIFVICMAVMIGLMYADKGGDSLPGSGDMKNLKMSGVLAFTYMFIGAILEILVAFTN